MKVMLLNGSPHERGCTYTALCEVEKALQEEGIETAWFQLGKAPIVGCTACGACGKTGKCVFDDRVNAFLELAGGMDGFVFGTPVYFASANGMFTAFMDRVFYCAMKNPAEPFYLKPAAAVCSARRAGTTTTLDQLNKYFIPLQMPIVPSRYWNMVHGKTPEDVAQDLEGLLTLRVMGRNMAWMLRCKEAAAQAGVPLPKREQTVMTNFIR